MTPNSRVHSILRDVSRHLPVLHRLYKAISNKQYELEALTKRLELLSDDLAMTRAELVASNKREDALSGELAAANERKLGVSHELSLAKAELTAANDREKWVSQELSIAKAELVESNEREKNNARELSIIKSELAAASNRGSVALGSASTGDDQLPAYNNILDDLTATKARLAASIDHGERLARRLSVAKARLAESAHYGEHLAREMSVAKANLIAANGREATISHELTIAKAELAAFNDRWAATKVQQDSGASVQDQLSAHSNLLLLHFADAQNHFKEAQDEFRRQLPMVSANLAALRSGQEQEFRSLRRRIVGPAAHGGTIAHDLYLDLLEASLTGTLYSDVSQSPWAMDIYDPARRAVGRDWPSHAETMIGTARMRSLRTITQRVLDENIPGDLIETGVWRGGACIYMRGILAAAGDSKRRVFVADSFCGLPPPNEDEYPADAGDPHHTFAQLAISRAEVEANFRRYGLLDDQVIFLEGWFKDVLPAAPIDQLALLRLDGDMYESTMDALNALYGKVSPGGFVIVDDYVLEACAAAVEDFRGRHGISAPLNEVDGAAVWWQVPGGPHPNTVSATK